MLLKREVRKTIEFLLRKFRIFLFVRSQSGDLFKFRFLVSKLASLNMKNSLENLIDKEYPNNL